MTFLRRYLDWATHPGEALPGYLKMRVFVFGPIAVVLALIWLGIRALVE